MKGTSILIVNADDFGLSGGINRGIVAAHEWGIVTSASLMVRWPAAAEAAAYALAHPALDLGLHIDLGEWTYRDAGWLPLYEVVALDDLSAVADEVTNQVAAFRSLTASDPTHLDAHQHVHRREPTRSVMIEAAGRLGVPLRHFSGRIRYCGDFYGQTTEGFPFPEGISTARLIGILRTLPGGCTELCCHPGFAEDVETMYNAERSMEVAALCDPQIRAAIAAAGIELSTFRDVTRP